MKIDPETIVLQSKFREVERLMDLGMREEDAFESVFGFSIPSSRREVVDTSLPTTFLCTRETFSKNWGKYFDPSLQPTVKFRMEKTEENGTPTVLFREEEK